jgi:hypothetical protein
MKIKRQTKSSDTPKIYCYDRENYTKPMICNICKCKFNNKAWSIHIKTENHKLAVQLTSLSIKPIEDIKKTILEYKMVQKYMNKRFPNDTSSTNSTLENVDLLSSEDNEQQAPKKDIKASITIDKIRHKTEVYARQLAHKVEVYEKTKAINILVNTIQNSTKRLTNLQKEKYYYLLNKYPENEYLISIKHLVPEIVIKPPKEPKPIKQPKIKQVKKKQKVYPIIVYKDTTINTNDKLSYPIIVYKDSTFNINDKVSYPTIEYKDNNNKISYPIIKYEHKL